jgi:hypothetical protein
MSCSRKRISGPILDGVRNEGKRWQLRKGVSGVEEALKRRSQRPTEALLEALPQAPRVHQMTLGVTSVQFVGENLQQIV